MGIKFKNKFDKFSTRGIIYSVLGLIGISYEIITSEQIETFLIIMYSFVVAVGLYCLFILEEID